jgi:hypothetical protein
MHLGQEMVRVRRKISPKSRSNASAYFKDSGDGTWRFFVRLSLACFGQLYRTIPSVPV